MPFPRRRHLTTRLCLTILVFAAVTILSGCRSTASLSPASELQSDEPEPSISTLLKP